MIETAFSIMLNNSIKKIADFALKIYPYFCINIKLYPILWFLWFNLYIYTNFYTHFTWEGSVITLVLTFYYNWIGMPDCWGAVVLPLRRCEASRLRGFVPRFLFFIPPQCLPQLIQYVKELNYKLIVVFL